MTGKIQELETKLAALEADAQADARERIDVMNDLAWELRRSDLERAHLLGKTAYESASSGEFEAQPYLEGKARSLCTLGYFNLELSHYDLALSQLLEALTILESVDLPQVQVDVLCNLGIVYRRLGRYPEVLAQVLEGLMIAKEVGYKSGQARALVSIGAAHNMLADYPQALSAYEKALQHLREIGDQHNEAITLNNMAMSYCGHGDYANALACGLEGLQIARETGFVRIEIITLSTVGELYLKQRNYDQALTYLEQALDAARESDYKYLEMAVLLCIGRFYHESPQDSSPALSYLQQTLRLADEIKAKGEASECHELMSEIYEQRGDLKQALHHFKRFHAIKEEVFSKEADDKARNPQVIHETETAKKEAEIAHLKNVELEQEIAERKRAQAQAQQAQEAAEVANQAKSVFLTNMSHELRTPLNSILGYAQILKRDPSIEQHQRDGLDIVEQSGEHLRALINDILDLAKVEAGRIELYQADFHFPAFLKGVCEIIRIRAEWKNLFFEFKAGQLPTAVHGDEKRLRQVLINLLGNAVKFTDRGRVTFKVEGVELEDQSPSSKIRFQGKDTGIGISSDDIESIFDPFHQVADHTRTAQEGTGLGLAICRNLVELMGGALHVESKLGEGSTFWFDIPLPQVVNWRESSPVESRPIVGLEGQPPSILVVDDNGANRAVLLDLLSPLGFEVTEAGNGHEGLAMAKELEPDVIITDLVMPEMDGFELTRQIRQSPMLKDTIIIATSASAFEQDHQKSLDAGCDALVPKPIRADDLLEQLRRLAKLEWIYEDTDQIAEQVGETALPMVPPPPDKVAALFKLAMVGDIRAIRQQAERLEQMDHRLEPFARELRRLARGFQIDGIREMLKSYLE